MEEFLSHFDLLGKAIIEQPEWRIADSTIVHFLNCVQLSYAKERIFYKPLSGLHALAERAPAARLARPEGLGPSLIGLDLLAQTDHGCSRLDPVVHDM
jgi:hypothetical protein